MKKLVKLIVALTLVLTTAVVGIGTAFALTLPTPENNGVVDRSFKFDASLEGKSVIFYGDSITAGLGLGVTENDYMEYLADELGFYYYNAGSSGATVTRANSTDTSGNTIYRQLKNTQALYRDADYICIFLGTNDWGVGRALEGDAGQQKGGMKSPADGTSIYGAYKQVLTTIIEANPDVKITLLTPTLRRDVWSTTFVEYDTLGNIVYGADGKPKSLAQANGGKPFVASVDGNNFASVPYSINDITEAIKEIGEAFGASVIDLSGLVNEQNADDYLNADGIHFKEAGYRAMANMIMGK